MDQQRLHIKRWSLAFWIICMKWLNLETHRWFKSQGFFFSKKKSVFIFFKECLQNLDTFIGFVFKFVTYWGSCPTISFVEQCLVWWFTPNITTYLDFFIKMSNKPIRLEVLAWSSNLKYELAVWKLVPSLNWTPHIERPTHCIQTWCCLRTFEQAY